MSELRRDESSTLEDESVPCVGVAQLIHRRAQRADAKFWEA